MDMKSFCLKILVIGTLLYIMYITGWLIAYEIVRIKYDKNIKDSMAYAIAFSSLIYFATWLITMIVLGN